MFYSLPVLIDVLPQPYFKHFSMLVSAIRVLNSDHITGEELDAAEGWLRQFYMQYTELYGMIIIAVCAPIYYYRCKELYYEHSSVGPLIRVCKGLGAIMGIFVLCT